VIDGKTPLMEAVWLNCEGAVEILLEDPRVDADFALPVKGTTALMVAEIRGYRIIADLLLADGADPDRPDCTGITPRMMREVPSEKKLELVLEQSEKMCKVGDQLADERYKRSRERLHRRVQERRRSRDQRRGLVS
jgi:ankyrin repeat protein